MSEIGSSVLILQNNSFQNFLISSENDLNHNKIIGAWKRFLSLCCSDTLAKKAEEWKKIPKQWHGRASLSALQRAQSSHRLFLEPVNGRVKNTYPFISINLGVSNVCTLPVYDWVWLASGCASRSDFRFIMPPWFGLRNLHWMINIITCGIMLNRLVFHLHILHTHSVGCAEIIILLLYLYIDIPILLKCVV